jgi:hypothetical protein
MPHIVKKTYLLFYIALCLYPIIFIFSDLESFPLYDTKPSNLSATVTTTLSSSATGDTFCTGDAVTFTATPEDGKNYKFYINGILNEGPSNNNIFQPTVRLFDGDKITVTLEKGGDTGSASLTVIENIIDEPGRIFFNGQSITLEELTVYFGSNSVKLESHSSATIRGTVLTNADTRYQWMSSNDKKNWTAIINANQRNYNPPRLTTTTYFRRDVVNDLNGVVCRSQSNILTLEVEVELKGGTVSPVSQTLCKGEQSQELKVQGGITGRTVTYQWQKSLDNLSFTDIPINGKSISFQPGTVTQTTFYRRLTKAVDDSCTPQPSTVHKITVMALDAGVFDPAHSSSICYDTAPPEFSTWLIVFPSDRKQRFIHPQFLRFLSLLISVGLKEIKEVFSNIYKRIATKKGPTFVVEPN